MSYPKTRQKEANALAAKGSFKVGCKVENGELIPAALTFKEALSSPAGATWADYSAASGRFFAVAGGRLYTSLTGTKYTDVTTVSGEPFLIEEVEEGNHKAFVICGAKCVVYEGATFFEKPFNRNIFAGVMKCGRLFGVDSTDKTVIRWSGTGGAFDWAESIGGAGWVKLDAAFGKVLNLVILGDEIIAVREFGLTAISAFGTPENFKQTDEAQKTPQIFKNTAAIVNGKLYFYTVEGLYSFDGNKAVRVQTDDRERVESPAYAAVYGQSYCVCGTSAGLKRKAVFVYETVGGAGYFIDFPAQTVCAHGKLLAFTQDGAYFSENGGKYLFESGEMDFGTTATKALTKIEISGGEAELTLSNGVVSRIVGGVSGSVRASLRGKSFKITLKGDQKLGGVKAFAEVGMWNLT